MIVHTLIALVADAAATLINPFQGAWASTGTADIDKILDSVDIVGARAAVSTMVRALGYGPEADAVATAVVGFVALMVVIGYVVGPKNEGTTDKDDCGVDKRVDKK